MNLVNEGTRQLCNIGHRRGMRYRNVREREIHLAFLVGLAQGGPEGGHGDRDRAFHLGWDVAEADLGEDMRAAVVRRRKVRCEELGEELGATGRRGT